MHNQVIVRPILFAIAFTLAVSAIACGHNAAWYLDRGHRLASEGKYQDAEVNFRRVIQAEPGNGEASFQLGLVLLHARKTQDAYLLFSQAAARLPERNDIAISLADLMLTSYLSDPAHPQALYDRVLAIADRLLASDAQSFDGLRLKAHLIATDKKFVQAEELYRRANSVRPLKPEVLLGLTETLLQSGKTREGEELALKTIAIEKTYGPMYQVLYRYYASAGREGDAEQILRRQVANNPGRPECALQLAAFYAGGLREADTRAALSGLSPLQTGDFYAGIQRWDDALREYETGERLKPEEKVTYLRKIATVWIAQGKSERARNVVAEILRIQPGDDSAQGIEASLLLASGKPDDVAKAVAELQTLVHRHPEDPQWHFNLGRGLAAKGDTDGARTQFGQAVRSHTGFLPPHLALIELSLSRGDYPAALQYADEALVVFPNVPALRLAQGVALMYTGQTARAGEVLNALERTHPENAEIAYQIAILDLRTRKFSLAEERFRKLLERGSDQRALPGLVQTLKAAEHGDRAVAVVQEQLKRSPQSIPLRSLLAATAAETGDYELSTREYQALLAIAPQSVQLSLALGTVYRLKGDLPGALACFERAHNIEPNDPAPMVRLGGTLALTGRRAEALAWYRRAITLQPNDAASLSNTAFLIVETGGDPAEALALARKAMQLDPNQPNYSDTAGWALLKMRDTAKATQVFRQLSDRYPEAALFHYHLAMAFLQDGDKTGARREFAAAMRNKPAAELRRNITAAMAQVG